MSRVNYPPIAYLKSSRGRHSGIVRHHFLGILSDGKITVLDLERNKIYERKTLLTDGSYHLDVSNKEEFELAYKKIMDKMRLPFYNEYGMTK